MNGDSRSCELTEPQLVALAGRLAAAAPHTALVFLNGPLGAGKTALVRAFLRALGVTGPVRSPTYTLIEPYELEPSFGGVGPERVLHLDLYRLGGADELEYLGLREELAQALVLVEWPERAEGALVAEDLKVDLDYVDETGEGGGASDRRRVTLTPLSAAGVSWIERSGLDLSLMNQSSV